MTIIRLAEKWALSKLTPQKVTNCSLLLMDMVLFVVNEANKNYRNIVSYCDTPLELPL